MEQSVLKKQRERAPTACSDTVAEEVCYRLCSGGACLEEFYCYPSDLRELTVGYLYAEGIISAPSDVVFQTEPQRQEDGAYSCHVRLNSSGKQAGHTAALCAVSGTGRQDVFSAPAQAINWDRVMEYAGSLLQASQSFRDTGCIHAAALCKGGRLCYFGEDISRFYAMYKAVGKALLAGESLPAYVLCTTGRLPLPYLQRAVRCGIRCVISRSAPTDLALRLANKWGVALFGFASRERVNYYPASIACCLLAGGSSSRAGGRDKAFFTYQGTYFAEKILREMCPEGEVLLSYNREAGPAEKLLQGSYSGGISVLRDLIPGIGPLGGMYTALKQAKSGAVLFAPCDLPHYSRKISQLCRQAFTGLEDAVIIKTKDGVQPLCGIYTKACIPALETMLADKNYRVRDLLNHLQVTYINAPEHGVDASCFANINTLQEYELL